MWETKWESSMKYGKGKRKEDTMNIRRRKKRRKGEQQLMK